MCLSDSKRQLVYRLLFTSLFVGGFLTASAAGAATLKVDTIRPDAEQYGEWTTKFQACGDFFHESEGLLLQEYDSAFSERVRQDLATQLRQPDFEVGEKGSNPAVDTYFSLLREVVEQGRQHATEQFGDVSPRACYEMEKAFSVYYSPFFDRVEASLRTGREAQERAQHQ